jgi:cbb3-type cytochrome oxidase subunit 3
MNRVDVLIAAFQMAYFQRIASVFFFVLFLLVVLRICLMPSRESARASRLPLEEDDDRLPRTTTHEQGRQSAPDSMNHHGHELE